MDRMDEVRKSIQKALQNHENESMDAYNLSNEV